MNSVMLAAQNYSTCLLPHFIHEVGSTGYCLGDSLN